MNVTLADSSSIPKLANLFNQYRIFYGEKTDLKAATDFLKSRFKNEDSVILIAHKNSQMGGFIQLYPSFSSVGMQKIWILNDLFVDTDFRRQNVENQHLNKDHITWRAFRPGRQEWKLICNMRQIALMLVA